jgi:NhaA family Na+:H+ antiporter
MLSRINKGFYEFVKLESASSILLLMVAVLALLMSNSAWAPFYATLLHTPIISTLSIEIKPLTFWINDGLMAIFFLLVGLELKREMLEDELFGFFQVVLSTGAAIGGMIVPALIYVAFNWHDPTTVHGWAIPTVTDVAFSLGILALLGRCVPLSLKLFLLELAIIEDLVIVIKVALFYSEHDLQLFYLALAMATLAVPVILFYWKGVTDFTVYLIVGLVLWFFFLKSGIHPTIAGVALAFFIPNVHDSHGHNLLHLLEKALHPWVAFGILPLFVFANIGVSFEGMTLSILWESLPLGIVLGLFVGKQLGVFGFAWLMIKLGLAELPERATWVTLYGVATLCGVGFSMSLFFGALEFTEAEYMNQVRFAVLLGSFVSGVVGYLILLVATAKQGPIPESEYNNYMPR